MLKRHGFSLHSAGVTGGSTDQLTIAFFSLGGVLLKDLLVSLSPGGRYQPLSAVPKKTKKNDL